MVVRNGLPKIKGEWLLGFVTVRCLGQHSPQGNKIHRPSKKHPQQFLLGL